MSIHGDGGPAFPACIPIEHSEEQGKDYPNYSESGMTLRDWFAGQALASMGKLLPEVWNEHDCGKIAYVIADAMLKARQR